MLRSCCRLTTKSDVLPVLVSGLVCLMIGGIILALVKSPAGRWVVLGVLGGICLIFLVSMLLRIRFRYLELRKGRCPNPLCHGVVQHSENVPRGFVVCPTCGAKWPEIGGINFKFTARD